MLLSQVTGGGEGINGRWVVCSLLERITEVARGPETLGDCLSLCQEG